MNEKTDRGLLELAAKAACIEIARNRLDDPLQRNMLVKESTRNPGQPMGEWNPLNDDGDAMALQRALYLSIDAGYHCCQIVVSRREYAGMPAIEVVVNGDRPGATMTGGLYRRAIVMAAAQIGEAMP